MSNSLNFFLTFSYGAVGSALIKQMFQFFIDDIPLSILPFGINDLDSLHEDSGAVLMVEVVLLEGKHFVPELLALVEPLHILLLVDQVLNILEVGCPVGSLVPDEFVDGFAVEVGFR